jgi:[protein-PII] uridylyltransferase
LNLQNEIEVLIEKDASEFEISALIKKDIKNYLNSFNNLLEEKNGKNFLVQHTKNIDKFIKIIYKYIIRKNFQNYSPSLNSIPITIVALGSYGREQLCIYSDIDLMILYKEIEGYNITPIIESILQMSWDSGLKIGHRVHELDDLLRASQSDQTIKTALLESRFIYGSKFIWMESSNILRAIRNDNQEKYINEKIKEYYDREKTASFSMQPNIKNSAGGLRDFNTLFWIANTLHNITKIRDITPSIISNEEYSELMHGVDFLYKVRIALHLNSSKKQDKLIFDLIPSVAKTLGITQNQLIFRTFKSQKVIKILSKILIHRLIKDKIDFKYEKEMIFPPSNTKSFSLQELLKEINQRDDKDISYDISYVQYVKENMNQKFNYNELKIELTKLFYKNNLFEIMMFFYRANILTTLIPPFSKIIHLAQFDGYHHYAVDIHLLKTLYFTQNIEEKNIKNLYDNLSEDNRAILKIATFLHDCGKGRKSDHSFLGATIIKNYLKELGFKDILAQRASILVKYHTLMSETALNNDIYSQRVIYSFLSKIRDITNLQMLYILTYADINAVGEGVFTSNTSKLLQELYYICTESFDNENMINEASKRSLKEKKLKKLQEFKALRPLLKKKILSIESNLLFFKIKPQQIINISTWAYQLNNQIDFRIENEKNLSISIIRKQNINLGYLLNKLTNYNLINMDIFKIFNEVKYMKIEFEERADESEFSLIEQIVQNSIDMEKKVSLISINIDIDNIKVNCNHSKSYGSMFVDCKNQRGIVANIITIFDDMGIDIASAKIQTIKNRAKNLFLIEKNGNFCNNSQLVINKLIAKRK